VVVCSRLYGMGLAYSLNEAHVGDHCERVGAQPGMRMTLLTVQTHAIVQGQRTAFDRPEAVPSSGFGSLIYEWAR
jgi:hypothetical protein